MSKRRRKRTRWQISAGTTERTNEQRLDDMLEFATQVTECAKEEPRDPRDAAIRRHATIYRLETIGVAAAGMTERFRAARPSIPWEDAMAMQEFLGKPDRLLDFDAVDKAIHELVPVLLGELTKLKSGAR